MMLTEVLAAEPSRIALTMASSELRRTLQWPPSIAEILKAIREQELRWQYQLRCLSGIVPDHAQTLSKLLERRAWLARPATEKQAEREERLERLQSLKQLLRAGANLNGYVGFRADIAEHTPHGGRREAISLPNRSKLLTNHN
jgi:hypothetical protein